MDKRKGLQVKYIIQKVNGHPTDPNAYYFVLRVDSNGEPCHVRACRKALRTYAENISTVLPEFAKDLNNQLDALVQKDEVLEKAEELRKLTNELQTNFILPPEHKDVNLSDFKKIITMAEPKLLAEIRKPLDLDTFK